MKLARALIVFAALAVAGVYLFISAPPPLADGPPPEEELPIQTVFEILNQENASARELYTKEIVGAGSTSGLTFNERWRTAKDGSGPLPALFLREIALRLESQQTGLGLYLGSEHPVNSANAFRGEAKNMFEQVKKTRRPVFAYAPDTGMFTAMFPDLAVAAPCVKCHNDHLQSPKHDWQLGDVMGAVTWTHRRDRMTASECAQLIASFRVAVGDAYHLYLERAAVRSTLVIGDDWPRDGYALPSREVFLGALSVQTSSITLGRLITALARHP